MSERVLSLPESGNYASEVARAVKIVAVVLSRLAWSLFSIGFFAGLWELAWAFGWTNPHLLPPPHIFLGNILEQAKYFSPALRWSVGIAPAEQPSPLMAVLSTVGATAARVIAGLVLATALSIALGIGVRRYRFVERLTLPTVLFLAPVSPIAWLPVSIFLFGIGNPPAIFMVFIALFFTMTLATIAQIDGVSESLIDVARANLSAHHHSRHRARTPGRHSHEHVRCLDGGAVGRGDRRRFGSGSGHHARAQHLQSFAGLLHDHADRPVRLRLGLGVAPSAKEADLLGAPTVGERAR
jgi:ABC-type nitrate/sulfonate/bicarbonate transport system permease component